MENNHRYSGGKKSLTEIQAEQERERGSGRGKATNQQEGLRSSGRPHNSYNSGGGGNGCGGYHTRSGSGGDSGGGGRRGSNARRGSDRSSLPLERGHICSLKEKFGFIHCADRPAEIFFHYSEVSNLHPDHLLLDDEVEFRVGRSRDNPDKLEALEVHRLPAGTIEWEYQVSPGERFQGLIYRPLTRSGGSNALTRRNNDHDNSSDEGLIQMLVPALEANKNTTQEPKEGIDGENTKGGESNNGSDAAETKALDTVTASEAPKIRFTANDFNPHTVGVEPDGDPGKLTRQNSLPYVGRGILHRGDLVEFTLVVEKRSRQKFARNIMLLVSERGRIQLAREAHMLANATMERGVVVSLKQEFGFLRSNARRDEVYFHQSHVELPEYGCADSADKENSSDDYKLQIGQEMEFLVVSEGVEDRNNSNSGSITDRGGRKQRTSARMVRFLPRGSVKFDKVIAEGVTGKVMVLPRVDAGRNAQKEGDLQYLGSILLSEPITIQDHASRASESVAVATVLLRVGDAPGGIFCCSRGAAMGLWIREGDTLLFDVTYDFVNKAYYAIPTKHLTPISKTFAAADGMKNSANSNGMKEEGTFARNKDEHSNEEVTTGGRNNGSNKNKQQKQYANSSESAVRLISLALAGRSEGHVHTVKDAYGFIHFAERPVDVHFKQFELLPHQVQDDLRRNMGLLMSPDTKADFMGFHKLSAGSAVQFDLSVQGTVMTQNQHPHHSGNSGTKRGIAAQSNQHERENLKAQRILILPKGTILQKKTIGLGIKGVITKEDPNQPYAGVLDLKEEYMQMGWAERHPLVDKMLDEFLQDESSDKVVFHDIQSPKEEEVIEAILAMKGKGKYELTHIPHAGDSRYLGRLCIRKLFEYTRETQSAIPNKVAQRMGEETVDAKNEEKQGEEKEETASKGSTRSRSSMGEKTKSAKHGNKAKKVLHQKLQPVKTLRYDKSSLTQNAKTDVPPGAGDVITCDVHQNRRTGKLHVENLTVVERKLMGTAEAATIDGVTGIGVVKEVVPASKFGFVFVSDETASKRELLFFHFDSVVKQNSQYQQLQHGRNKKGDAQTLINKGDEVTFKVGTGKNGKRLAVDVQVVSTGTFPNKVDKNACRGFILVEPTDTKVGCSPRQSRSFSRSRDAPSTQKTGRWDNTKEDHHKDELREEGEGVILLLEDPAGMFASGIQKAVAGKKVFEVNGDQVKDDIAANCIAMGHLHYQNGAVALHGIGAPTTMDTSTNPRRGDLVSFVKSKNNGSGVKDVRVVTRAVATLVRGHLDNIDHLRRSAKFVTTGDDVKEYQIDMQELVSCDPTQLKNCVEVEGVLHGNALHGICRTSDLRLKTKLGIGRKERPKLNLTVKKDRAGTIMAQSMMAKGPDGTTGFPVGWTSRSSRYAQAPQS